MRLYPLLLALVVTEAGAAPVRITCNGYGLDPRNGRPATAGVLTFAFEFDQAAQTMRVTEGAQAELRDVAITDATARGADAKWIYEINRIDGTAAIRPDPRSDPDAARLGITGPYFRGACAPTGLRKF